MELRSVIQGDGVVTNLEFHSDGQYLVMTTNESAIQLIDCFTGNDKKKIFLKGSGVNKIQYTHHESCVLTASDHKGGFDIKYLCMYDNRFIRNFRSHTSEITSLSMSPISDNFLSTSTDRSVCIWDMAVPNPVAKLNLPAGFDKPFCSFDPSGLVFGVLGQDSKSHSSSLKLFDARAYQHGPFDNIFPKISTLESAFANSSSSLTTSQVHRFLRSTLTGFEFSQDGGRSILVNSNTEAILILDGFKATVEPKIITSRKNDSGVHLGAAFSSDAKHVITANEDNEVLVFDKDTTELLQTLPGHVAPVGCVRCNKVYDVMATGCVNTALWTRPATPSARHV